MNNAKHWSSERLLKLMDYRAGSFQDFAGHSDGVTMVKFSQDGARLVTVSHNELFLWEVMLWSAEDELWSWAVI